MILLIPMGTPGDVQPFVEIGRGLVARGVRAGLVAHAPCESWARRYGLEFIELGSARDFQLLLDDANLWNINKAHRVFAKKLVLPTLRPMVEIIEREMKADASTVVVAQSMAMGARVAQEALGAKVLTLHRQPTSLRSVIDPPKLPYLPMGRGVPRWARRAQYWLMDRFVDHVFAPGLNAFRAEFGLPAIKSVLGDWLHSPDGVIGMWPEWFAPPQADWPGKVRLAGFDVQSTSEREPSAALVKFLDEGEPPIVFTTGSGMKHGARFYAESAKACALLNRRGILATRFADQVPAELPAGVMHVDYAPFQWLLPRCGAAVHHAGIGTVAQCLAAGVRQLCVPGMVFDNADNAGRLERLGVSRTLDRRRYQADRVAGALRGLLADAATGERCREMAKRVNSVDAVGVVCDWVESMR